MTKILSKISNEELYSLYITKNLKDNCGKYTNSLD